MSQENVDLVRRAYQAFNDRDLDTMLDNLAEDVEWRLIGGFAAHDPPPRCISAFSDIARAVSRRLV